MAISRERRVTFLKERQLFKEYGETDIGKIADRLIEFKKSANEPLLTHGDRGRTFYIIYSGKVRVWRKEQGEEVDLAILESGDIFGEEALLFNRPRSASVTPIEDCVFLTMDIKEFNWMLRTYPETKTNLQAIAASHQQARKLRFKWLHQGEVVHLITRRHIADMFFDLGRPLLFFILALFIMYLANLLIPNLPTLPLIISLGMAGIATLWALWEVIDWLNDYFIITNERIVWLEQMLLQSASRQEAPMAAIQSVNVDTSFFGRILGFGNVFIRTFTGTGSLRLTNVSQPTQFTNLIEELLIRARSKTDEAQEKLMRQSIRQSLGLGITQPVDPALPIIEPEDDDTFVVPLFRTREVKGDVITYHKHWLVLLSEVWIPILIFIGLSVLSIYLWVNDMTLVGISIPIASSVLVLGGGILVCLGWIIYEYLDWLNDIYKLTKETIIDSERKPLGREITKSAPIKNILSIEHSREGILRLLLNYGIVNVVIADTTLTFYDVHNPARVQQDIFYRQQQIKREQEAAEAEQQRAQMSEWLKAYHEISTTEVMPATDEEEGEDTPAET